MRRMTGQRAIEAAFRGHGSLKHVVVVDEDVNPFDPNDVEWAIATRFQADRGLVVLTDQPSSSLDPSAQHMPRPEEPDGQDGPGCDDLLGYAGGAADPDAYRRAG